MCGRARVDSRTRGTCAAGPQTLLPSRTRHRRLQPKSKPPPKRRGARGKYTDERIVRHGRPSRLSAPPRERRGGPCTSAVEREKKAGVPKIHESAMRPPAPTTKRAGKGPGKGGRPEAKSKIGRPCFSGGLRALLKQKKRRASRGFTRAP